MSNHADALPPRPVDYHRVSRRLERQQRKAEQQNEQTTHEDDGDIDTHDDDDTHDDMVGSSNIREEVRYAQDTVHKYEYLDHTADVQFHAWGDTLTEAFEQVIYALNNFMIDREHNHVIDADAADAESAEKMQETVDVNSHSIGSLLFAFMDEFLYRFSVDGLVVERIRITQPPTQRPPFAITAEVNGERYKKSIHGQGTEIKAITYSNMQVYEKGILLNETSDDEIARDDVDPSTDNSTHNDMNSNDKKEQTTQEQQQPRVGKYGAEIYVIVDI